jgi:23S rRNA (cytidine1920-2'-O)/16S rRNA (cytidine1409-2'-O)-methyltransferase
MAGAVYADGQRILKSDTRIDENASLEIKGNPILYVGFGGVKLKAAIDAFGINITDMVVLDVGSSTGGFTDCLLQGGARKIYAIDSGTHQLHEKLRNDERIILKENFNARYLCFDDIGEMVDMITIDVSFISLKKIVPAVIGLVRKAGHVIALIKPQFEVGRYNVGKGGIVKDDNRIKAVVEDISEFGEGLGLKALDIIEAPREKERKNREYLIIWEK